MAILNIVKEGDEILRKNSKPVGSVSERVKRLLDDMGDTLIRAEGVGLAAVQVGVLKKLFIIDDGNVNEGEHHIVEFIDPEIVSKSGEQHEVEGCLSIPGKYGTTVRPKVVTVEATDRYGKKFRYTGKDLYARALCHETDHLYGILYTDHATDITEEEES